MLDSALENARQLVVNTGFYRMKKPLVTPFFDEQTNTVSYLVQDPLSNSCTVIDSVLGFDLASGRTNTLAADGISHIIRRDDLQLEWLLETHVHADHLSAAPVLKHQHGGQIAIGSGIKVVQQGFDTLFHPDTASACDGSEFDHLFSDGESFRIGQLDAIALHVPGHTPACMAYLIGDALFVGDTLFMPDYGTARCDFPGGSAAMLYQSIRRLQQLPDDTRVFLCHDYKAADRDSYQWETTMGEQRRSNVHVHDGVTEAEFVQMREARDATLAMPRLLLPSVQVNVHAGNLPEPEANGIRYLKIPLNTL
jgi:glyoxylase-like metal-dependent hydrolase (beta-lactamase superfamily II)